MKHGKVAFEGVRLSLQISDDDHGARLKEVKAAVSEQPAVAEAQRTYTEATAQREALRAAHGSLNESGAVLTQQLADLRQATTGALIARASGAKGADKRVTEELARLSAASLESRATTYAVEQIVLRLIPDAESAEFHARAGFHQAMSAALEGIVAERLREIRSRLKGVTDFDGSSITDPAPGSVTALLRTEALYHASEARRAREAAEEHRKRWAKLREESGKHV